MQNLGYKKRIKNKMKQTINIFQFRDAFLKSDTYKDNFSYEGLRVLFEYFEELEEDTGQEMELDVVAICCEFQEMDSVQEFNEQYGEECDTMLDVDFYTPIIPIDDERFIIYQY